MTFVKPLHLNPGEPASLLADQNRILEMIARGIPLPNILESLAQFIESCSSGLVCTFMVVDKTGSCLHWGAAPRLARQFIESVPSVPIGPSSGSCGTAAFRREPVNVDNVATDPLWVEYRDLALRYGLQACWSTPIFSTQDEVLGTFAIYYRSPHSPTAAEHSLIQVSIHLAGIAIEREGVETSLRQSEQKFRAMFERSAIATGLTNLAGEVIESNPALQDLLGYSQEELAGLRFTAYSHPEDTTVDQALFDDLLANRRDFYQLEKRYIRKDGRLVWGCLTVCLVKDLQENPLFAFGMIEDISQRKKAEAELVILNAELERRVQERTQALQDSQAAFQESQAQLQAILNNAPVGIFVKDLHHRYTLINPNKELTSGQSAADFIGKTEYDFFLPEIARTLQQNDQKVLDTGEAIQFEETVLLPFGYKTCLSVKFPLRNVKGEIYGLCGICVDLTEHKRAEEELRVSQARLQTLINNLPFGVWALDSRGCKALENPVEVSYFGSTLGSRPEETAQPEALKQIWLESNQRALAGEVVQGEVVHNLKGQERTFLNIVAPVPEGSEGLGLIGVNIDITERKQIEQALQESRQKYQTLFETVPIGIVITDDAGQVLEANPTSEEILGIWPGRATSDRSEWRLLRSDGHFMPVAPFRELITLLENNCLQTYEAHVTTPHGQSRWFSLTATPIPLAGYGMALTFTDITEGKQLERQKDEFIAIVSHELRTPLTSMRVLLGLLAAGRLGSLTEHGQQLLSVVLADTNRQERLINDILDLERLKVGRAIMRKQSCPVDSLINQVVQMMQPLAQEAGIQLVVNNQCASVWADPDRIMQILTNLIGNAIKFSPPSTSISIRVSPAGNDILWQVSDQGRGIPADKLTVIFEPFQQIDTADYREKSGTGLGLAICHQIIEQHGGHIWVESGGSGSTFKFLLPTLPESSLSGQNP